MSARHGRQIRLAEVGVAGQSKLDAATRALQASGDEARHVERAYLEGAGVRASVGTGSGDERVATLLAALELEHVATRDVAEGALAALVGIRDVLGR